MTQNHLLKNLKNGTNACIIAYGPEHSGKSKNLLYSIINIWILIWQLEKFR